MAHATVSAAKVAAACMRTEEQHKSDMLDSERIVRGRIGHAGHEPDPDHLARALEIYRATETQAWEIKRDAVRAIGALATAAGDGQITLDAAEFAFIAAAWAPN